MAHEYHLPKPATMTSVSALTGRYLAHNQESRIGRAFLAAELHSGVKQLIKPTMVQAAFLARVSTTYGSWAEKRQGERPEIEAGLIPLVPAARTPKANGHLPVPATNGADDQALFDMIITAGIEKTLAIAAMVEQEVQQR